VAIFGKFDSNGRPLGFWDDKISEPPGDAVEIDAADRDAFVTTPQAWVFQNGARVAAPPPALAELKAKAFTHLADRRWQAEIGGISINGSIIATDEKSQAKFMGAVVAAMLDANYSVQWKMPGGSFVTFNHDQIIAVGQAMRAHVQACFDREAELSAQINGASDAEAIAAIDLNAGWPA
jgi:hypothetical protein